MTRKQALTILDLKEGAEAEEIKRSYRKLAFALHPDLHPDNLNAGKDFQQLNEAYVLLTSPEPPKAQRQGRGRAGAAGQAQATEKARAEARKAYARAKKRFQEEEADGGAEQTRESAGGNGAGAEKTCEVKRDEVLRDLLRDPFARRVFEDIYNQIREESARKRAEANGTRAASRTRKPGPEPGFLEKAADNVSYWFRRQIDEEQTVRFAGLLAPGKRIRLQIHHGVFGKSRTIELTLPPEFEPGRAIRLKGLGKHIGKWRGDLYLRILGQ